MRLVLCFVKISGRTQDWSQNLHIILSSRKEQIQRIDLKSKILHNMIFFSFGFLETDLESMIRAKDCKADHLSLLHNIAT